MSGAVVIGAGPGIGRAVAQRFAREGLPVAVLARRQETVDDAAAALAPAGVPVLALAADARDERDLRAALDAVVEAHGVPAALVYNAALVRPDAPGELSAAEHVDAWRVNVLGAYTAAAHVARQMAARGTGSILLTGGMPEPVAAYTSLSLGKAGLRTLAALLHEHLGPRGVHVATVTVGGYVEPGGDYDPDDIAEHYWRLHVQRPEQWELEVRHG
ncbi:MAG TPA: SDR family NAD(P)-dependent oxidoreductase [Solirubrobacteraceae bacterium]|nr:SDR family NAD(P)-dependent oxidoreductase [Solirubrobacteraceae bacterium]